MSADGAVCNSQQIQARAGANGNGCLNGACAQQQQQLLQQLLMPLSRQALLQLFQGVAKRLDDQHSAEQIPAASNQFQDDEATALLEAIKNYKAAVQRRNCPRLSGPAQQQQPQVL